MNDIATYRITQFTLGPIPEVHHESDECVEPKQKGVQQQECEHMVVRISHTIVDPETQELVMELS